MSANSKKPDNSQVEEEEVEWPDNLAEGIEPKPLNRKRVHAPKIRRNDEDGLCRIYDGSLEILTRFFSLCDLHGSIQDVGISTSQTQNTQIEGVHGTSLRDAFYPKSEIKQNSYLQNALVVNDERVAIRKRRFLPLAESDENSAAAKLALRLQPIIEAVLDDYSEVRNLGDTSRVNLTLRDLKGRRGDVQKLLQIRPELKRYKLNPLSMSIWKNARFNIARLWNWQMSQEDETGFKYPSIESIREKLGQNEVDITDLYSEPPPEVYWPKTDVFVFEGKRVIYAPRWREIPMLCQWCCRPILARVWDRYFMVPSIACSKQCAKSWNLRGK